VTEATWSRGGDGDCIRLTGLPAGADVRVFPGTAAAAGSLPPMAGRLERDGADLCFVPRFAFLDGRSYTVTVDGTSAAVLVRPPPERAATTEVTGIRPTAAEVPVNLLRCYVWFSAPMSEGYAAGHVRLARDDGSVIAGALLPSEHELWDASRRRLTVLLDPARIKRGLPGHQEAGYPLRPGEPFRLVVGDGFRDAQGLPLRAPAERRYEVGGEERRHVDPHRWELAVPPAGTCEGSARTARICAWSSEYGSVEVLHAASANADATTNKRARFTLHSSWWLLCHCLSLRLRERHGLFD